MATNLHRDDPADRALSALERLLKLYWFERYIYAAGAAAGMTLVLYAAYLTINGGGQDQSGLGFFFGAGGLLGISGGLTLRLLNKSFALVREVLLAGITRQ
jgi:hypothetical protein